MKKFIEAALVLAILLLTASAGLGQSAHATCIVVVGGPGAGASDSNTVLMLRSTVSTQSGSTAGTGETSDCASLEAVQAQALNLNVEIDDDAAWGAKTQGEFATYRAIVLGDPGCVQQPGPITAAQHNSSTWGPAITGPVALVGTDPEYHFINNPEPQRTTTAQLTQNAIALATSVPGKPGAYISLSCYYLTAGANTPVPVLTPFGSFTVQGADFNVSTIVDTGNPLVNTPNALNNTGLSTWNSSSHEAFDSYPTSNFSAVVNTNTSPTALPYIIAGQIAGTTPTQSQPPQPTGVNATDTFNFDTGTGNQVTHSLAFGPDAVVPPGIDPGTLMLQSINKVISNGTGDAPKWPQYVVGGPFATSLLFVKSGDNNAFGGTDLGSLYSDLCFDKNHAASDDVCPSSASGINIQDIFDVGGTKPDITPGTTAGMVHFLPSSSNPSETWTASPSSATSNPVCTQTLGATGGTLPQPPQQCDLSDVNNFILSGDQSGSGGRVKHKGIFATVNNIPMLESLVSANGTPVNTPGVQGTGITWFNTGSLNLDFKVNPGGCPFPFALTTCLASTAANNYYKPAPVSSLTYGVDLLPGTAPSVAAQPPADTSMVQQWDFNNNPLSLSEGVHVVVWEGIDNVGIQEQNVQLLHPGSPIPCPNPYSLTPVPTYPCYSTTLFTAQIGVDTVPPTITITTPPNGAVYLLNQAVAANYGCTDASSGIASCVGSVANGAYINTASAGGKTFTVTATDTAGNPSTTTVNYTVVDQPVNLDVFGTAQSRVRPGSTISYFITALNLSQKNVASGVVVTDTVPAGTTVVPGKAYFCKSIFACFIPSQGTPCMVSGPVVTCNIGSLAPLNRGAAVGIIIVVSVPSTTPLNTLLTDTVTATSLNRETDAPDNSVTIKTKVVQSTSE